MSLFQSSILFGCLALASGFLVGSQSKAAEDVVFEDRFENELADGWMWIREHGAHWCVRGGALEIRVVPGLADTVENALVRTAPNRDEGMFAIEVTVTNIAKPIQQYEQAGITLYQDGKPILKLVKELVNGQLVIIPGRTPIQSETVRLRLIVTANSYTAQYRAAGKDEFQTAATGKLPPPGKDQISIQCYNGPPDTEHWMRFDNFRILKLSEEASASE